MAAIDYSPIGHDGYSCRVSSPLGRSLQVKRTQKDDQPSIEGDESLLANVSLVRRTTALAETEMASRRARSEANRDALTESVKEHRRVIEDLIDLIEDVGDLSIVAWCSGCLERHPQRKVDRRSLTPDAYICGGCGAATTKCLVPGCKHFAIRKPGLVQLGKYCAEHLHVIPSFKKLDTKLTDLESYFSWLEHDSRHAKRITTYAGAAVGGALVLVPAFFLAAPAIGGAIGAWSGLSGAAASSHGLALLGGGALSAGGFGMAGGTAVVSAAGGGLGSALGASVASAYVGDDSSFEIEVLRRGDGPKVIFASGFLTEAIGGWNGWEEIVLSRYPDSTVYRLRWGSKEQADLRAMFTYQGVANGAAAALAKKASAATKLALKKIAPASAAAAAAGVAKNPWWVARTRAKMTGAVLADLIARTADEDYVLIGHSLGAHVMFSAAEALGSRDGSPQLESVHLLGAAVGADRDLAGVSKAVRGAVWNYWSGNDAVLRRVYRGAELGKRAAGATGFAKSAQRVKNRDVSSQVADHGDYVPRVTLR
jgi:hypothetical protein